MNYILHLNKTFGKFCEDDRLSPFHVSLYFALFQFWNIAKFHNPISISRDEVMRAAKIGSVNTYIRCMKEMDKWAYIQYLPSYNPLKGSKVHLYNFDKTNNNAIDISNDKGFDKAAKKTTVNVGETPVIPSINSTNKTNKLNNKNEYEHTKSKSSEESISVYSGQPDAGRKGKEKSCAKKEKIHLSPNSGGSEIPFLNQVKVYFVEKKWPLIEAEKFFNYYQSNGWLVGGKTPMRSWKAATKNWMINTEKFNNEKNSHPERNRRATAGKLHTTGNKDYSEPL